MHPIQAKIWQYFLVGLALAEVLSQITNLPFPLTWHSVPFILACFILAGLIIFEALSKMGIFDAIEVKGDMGIDTEDLYKAIDNPSEISDADLIVKMTFRLRWGLEAIRNRITPKLDDVIGRLNMLRQSPKPIGTIEDEEKPEYIELGAIPQTLTFRYPLAIRMPITKELIKELEDISSEMAKGHFKVEWEIASVRGNKKKQYKPKKLK